MKIYTVDPEQRAGLVRALIIRLATSFGAILLIALVIAAFFINHYSQQNAGSNVIVMVLAVIALAIIIIIRLAQQVRAYDRGLASLRIELYDERITKRQTGFSDVRISRTEVTALIETIEGVLIMTRDKTRFLWLPSQLAGYVEARTRLSEWMAIRRLPAQLQPRQRLLTAAWALATALCVGAMLFSTDPWQVVIAGAAVIAIYLYVYRLLSKQRSVDLKFRRTYSGVLLFLIIVVGVKLFMTLGPLMLH